MFTTRAVNRIAKSQIGYHEGYSNGHWNNDQKYSKTLPGFAWSDDQPWCATFVQWCLYHTGVTVPTGARSASCATSVKAYKTAGRFTEYPVIGGQIFFGQNGGTHTGLVYDYDDVYVYTVEGNTNTSGSPEGDGVYERKHLRKSTYVYGYGIPYYHGKAETPDPKWLGKELSK